jgi:hypothetical protein
VYHADRGSGEGERLGKDSKTKIPDLGKKSPRPINRSDHASPMRTRGRNRAIVASPFPLSIKARPDMGEFSLTSDRALFRARTAGAEQKSRRLFVFAPFVSLPGSRTPGTPASKLNEAVFMKWNTPFSSFTCPVFQCRDSYLR